MNQKSSLILVGVLGAFVGGGLVWFTLGPDSPTSSETPSQRIAVPASRVKTVTESPPDAAAEESTVSVADALTHSGRQQSVPPSGVSEQPKPGASSGDFGPTATSRRRISQSTSATSTNVNVNQKKADLSVLMDDVVVPIPSEVFAVLDKLGKPKWDQVMRTAKPTVKNMESRERIALLLGTVIAEGFIVIEAENAPALKDIGRTVLTLSEALGVREAVTRRCEAMMEAADKQDWPKVRKELDGSLSEVKAAMIEMQDEPLAQLVSLGGWLRGTEALTVVIAGDYHEDAAELLHQPILVDHFGKRLAQLPERNQSKLVGEMRKALLEMRPLMGDGVTALSKATVNGINEIAAKLIVRITTKNAAG